MATYTFPTRAELEEYRQVKGALQRAKKEDLQTLDISTLVLHVQRINQMERKGIFPYGYSEICPEQKELNRRRKEVTNC
jgi:hypothetical protein